MRIVEDDHLGLAPAVAVGGVDEIDPRIERLVNDADRLMVVGITDRVEHHRAQTVRTDLDPGATERTVMQHGLLSPGEFGGAGVSR